MAVTRRVRRLLGWLWRLSTNLGLLLVFVAAFAAGVALHLDTPPARRLAAELLSRGLSDLFVGSLEFEDVEKLSLRGASVREVRVYDPSGRKVLTVSDLRASADVLGLAEALLLGPERVTLVVPRVSVDRAEVDITPEEATGIPTLASAFAIAPTPGPKTTTPAAPSRYVRVWLPAIGIRRVYARGTAMGLPVLEVQLSQVRGSVLGTPKGAAIDVQRYGVVIRGLGGADTTGTGELHIRAPGAVWTSFDGFFGDLSANAFLHVKGDQIEARVDLPRARPEDVRTFLVDYPVQVPVNAHFEARGQLPLLQTSARITTGATRVSASGPLRVDKGGKLTLDVDGRDVDVRALFPHLPKTDFDVDAQLTLVNRGDRIVMDVNATTAKTQIDGVDVPPTDVSGSLTEKGFVGTATLHEEGVPLKLDFTVHPDGPVDLTARARSFDISRSPRLRKLTPVRGRVDVTVKARVEKERLNASVVADLRTMKFGDVTVAQATVRGTAKGPLDKPRALDINATVAGSGLATGPFKFGKVSGTADGSVLKPRVTAKLLDEFGPNVTASARVDLTRAPRVDDLSVEVKRAGAALSGHIDRIDLAKRELEVKDLKLSGAGGELTGSVLVSPERIRVVARGEGVDLDRVSRALGLSRGVLGGQLRVNTDLSVTRDSADGHVHFALGKGSLLNIGGVALRVNAELSGRSVSGDVMGTLDEVGNVGGEWDVQLVGPILSTDFWKRWTGRANANFSKLALGWLRFAAPPALAVSKVEGDGFLQMRVERDDAEQLPRVSWLGGTQQLAVHYGDKQTLKDVDVQLSGGVDGATGSSSGSVVLVDGFGALVGVTASARLKLAELLENPQGALELLRDTHVDGVVLVQERTLSSLPEQFRPQAVDATVNARVTWSGTPRDPRLGAKLNLENLRSTTSRLALPSDLELNAQYQPTGGAFAATGELTSSGRRAAWIIAKGNGPIDGRVQPSGNVQLFLEQAPLGIVPALADARVTGGVSGALVIERPPKGGVPYATMSVALSGATIDRVPIGGGSFSARSDGRGISAKATMTSQEGSLDLEAQAGVSWAKLYPDLDDTRPIQLRLAAKRFDAVVLSPFLRSVFSRLSGEINAGLATTLVARGKGDERHWTGQIVGSASMTKGLMQIAPLGIEVADVRFRATARDAGDQTAIEIVDVVGRSRSDKDNVKASATLYFDGLRVERGTGKLEITEVPVLVQGVPQANATGTATMDLLRQRDRMLVTVDVPTLEARLPQATSRRVIELADNPRVQVLQTLTEPTGDSGDGALPWRVEVKLGRDVKITRNDLRIPLSGEPVIELGAETSVTGWVDLRPGGRLQVLGKAFVIDSGRVLFDTGEPSNPHIAASATWRAPDGSQVFVDVTGTLKDARLRLTSDPPLPEAEVMALLLGGASDQAAGAVFGGLNAVFADAAFGLELRTASVDDKSTYTAAVRISDSVWFEGTYRQSETEGGQNASTGADRVDVSGTIDWRFLQNWSLRTEVGTLGTGLDLLWQYRY